jgi:hypothetical protein
VPTDNFPRSYIYISQRLLRERYQQHVAHQPSHRIESQFRPPLFTFELENRADPDNPFWLARQVTSAVKDLTGSLTEPGTYIRVEMPITWSWLKVYDGISQKGRYRVAWLSGVASTSEGDVFVALCGSLRNYVGISYPDVERRGWWPSTTGGLRHILAYFSNEEGDTSVLGEHSPDDDDVLVPFRTAHRFSSTLGAGHQIGNALLELLFQVFDYVEDVTLEGVSYRFAYLGTPLWAATAAPREFGAQITYTERPSVAQEDPPTSA